MNRSTASFPRPSAPPTPDGQPTADIVNAAVEKIKDILKDAGSPANMLTLRGFSKLPDMPSMSEVYKLNPSRHRHLSYVPRPRPTCRYESHGQGPEVHQCRRRNDCQLRRPRLLLHPLQGRGHRRRRRQLRGQSPRLGGSRRPSTNKSSTSAPTFSSSPETTRLPPSGQTTAGIPSPS